MRGKLLCLALAALLLAAVLTRVSLKSVSGLDAGIAAASSPPSASMALSSLISQNVEFVGQVGGGANAVAVQGQYAYVGTGPGLVVLNISNPGRPIVAGQLNSLPYAVQDVAVSGAYAYLADDFGGLRVVDVSTPTHPQEVGSVGAGGADGITVVGTYAYVADRSAHLRIIDISNPANPHEIGVYHAPKEVFKVAVAGSYAYLADGRGGLRVVDVSNPANPREIGSYSSWGVFDVAVSGNYAFLAAFPTVLKIIDISDPTHPTWVSSYEMPGAARGVTVVEPFAYVADDNAGLRIIYIGDKNNPVEVSAVDTPGSAYDVTVAGNYTYIGDGPGGLRVVKTKDALNPSEVGFYDALGYGNGVALAGARYAYMADYDTNVYSSTVHGLRIVDVADPTHPAIVGTFNTPGPALGVAAAPHEIALIAEGPSSEGSAHIGGGLRTVNVSDPTHPTSAGFYDTPQAARKVVASGDYAYVADGQSGLRIVSISDPAHPVEVGVYTTTRAVQDVAVAGHYAYVACELDGLHILDIYTPTHPIEVGIYTTTEWVERVAVAGDWAYVVDGALHIVNVSNPMQPFEVGRYDTYYFNDVAVIGDGAAYGYVYVAGAGVLYVLRVADPAHPSEVGYYETPDEIREMAATADGALYIADGSAGLMILRFHPPLPPVAGFSASPRSGLAPLTVAFTDQSSGTVTDWLWQFGEGLTSTLQNPTHTFAAAGWYTVTLTVSGPGGSDTLTRANTIRAYLPQPVLTAPICGMTNNTTPVVKGLAPHDFTITLYDNGAQLLTTNTTASDTFSLSPTLTTGQHVLTATATNSAGIGFPSRPLTLTVDAALPYDPAGVTFAYSAASGTITQHPRDESGCAVPGGWRVWLRQGYTPTVAVPVRYITSAAVTVTLGARVITLTEGAGQMFTGMITPPIDGGVFVIAIAADGQTVTASGSALIDPDGYVFDKNKWESQGITQTLSGVTLTCEVSDTVAGEWRMWEAWAYDQVNPQVTGADGYYTFFVPPGAYRITASRPGYLAFVGPDILVVDAPLRLNIPLVQWWQVYLPAILR